MDDLRLKTLIELLKSNHIMVLYLMKKLNASSIVYWGC